MAVYKDKKRGTWYCRFRQYDATGKTKEVTKRGFDRKRDAEDYEAVEKRKLLGSMEMPVSAFADIYLQDKASRIKPTTLYRDKSLFNNQILPYLGKYKMSDVSPLVVRNWHTELINKGLADTYLRLIHKICSSMFNFAVRYYGLSSNPCREAGPVGKASSEKTMQVWSPTEFRVFIDGFGGPVQYRILFLVLFWTGIRISEALGLEVQDYDFEKKSLSITKQRVMVNGSSEIQSLKTTSSNRIVPLPGFVYSELEQYIGAFFEVKPDSLIFPVRHNSVYRYLKIWTEKAGLPKIRIHDLRHSHATMLISSGTSIKAVSSRLGHKNIETTLGVYAHVTEIDDLVVLSTLEMLHETEKNI